MLTILASFLMARPLVLAHYMPWYESKSISGHWGWHWTMNHFDPERRDSGGRRLLASRFTPLIDAYDSSDPDALECQTLQMKIAGIDGVFIDWYGTKDHNDYAILNRNAQKMIDACSRAGLKFSIVMEDQVVPQLIKAGKSSADEFAKASLDWLRSRWFTLPGYLKWNGKPVLLMFGPQYYKDPDLARLFDSDQALITLLGKRGPAVGAFGWPEPQVGDLKSRDHLRSFYDRSKQWPVSVAVAYPRFEDDYKAAAVGPGYGEIEAAGSGSPFIQLATWNDWGEGTQIEPSVEFGYRDLETLQNLRRKTDSRFPYRSSDLRLPAELYRLRKNGASRTKLDQAAKDLLAGRCKQAAKTLDSMPKAR